MHPCCTCACSYIKVDGCGNNDYYPTGYAAMGAALEASGRDIVYSCSWPAYIGSNETEKPFGAWRRGASGQVMVAPRQRAAGRLVGCVVAAVGAGVAARPLQLAMCGPAAPAAALVPASRVIDAWLLSLPMACLWLWFPVLHTHTPSRDSSPHVDVSRFCSHLHHGRLQPVVRGAGPSRLLQLDARPPPLPLLYA